MTLVRLLAAPVSALALAAALPAPLAAQEAAPAAPAPVVAPADLPVDASIDDLFVAYDAASLAQSPQGKTYRGVRDGDYGKWNDPSEAAEARQDALLDETLAAMRARFASATLPPQQALSYRLFEQLAARRASLRPYRDYGYVFDQMNGAQSELPAFLINTHRV
ncbi:MAG: DUF885 family protein, partial [Erythrobacter sp.]